MLAAVYKSINLGKVGERMVDISTEKLEELENEVTSQNTKLKKMEEFVSPDKLYQELIQSVRKYHPSADISLIASERTVFSRYATPPQTTISQNYAAQASAVADALDARLSGQPFPRRTVIPYQLILRDSVR